MTTATKKPAAKLSRPATEPKALPATSEAKLRGRPAKKAAPKTNGANAHPQFTQFIDEVLTNPDARGAFEDAAARAYLTEQMVALRNERGLSQGQLAKLSGIGQATISHMEAGNQFPLHALQKILRALGAKLEIRLVR